MELPNNFKQINNYPKWFLLNGDTYISNYSLSLLDLLKFLNLENDHLIIEYNQKILIKYVQKSTFLTNFDKIEFVSIVGGG